MKKKIVYVEVIPNFPPKFKNNRKFYVPKGKRFGDQVKAALDNGWTLA